MKKTRNDKKFLVKVWVPIQDKALFRQHCMEAHLSMMFVGEKYLTKALVDFSDEKISHIIEGSIIDYKNTKDCEILGIRVTNDYWQKLAWFAVNYHSSVAKVASCIFDYSLSSYEMGEVFEKFGLTFKRNITGSRQDLNERVSDW